MIKILLNKNAKKTDIFLKKFLDKQLYSDLVPPMKYGALSEGKKIRSSVVLGSGKLFNIKEAKLLSICAAVECIHSYSLIHDDLPCMDNDKIRRGKPATHIKFGESTAILAGNSLLTLAFELIVDKNYKIENIPDEAKSKSIKEIKEEINQILEKLESKDTDLPESMNEYARLISLNKKIDLLFKKRSKEISSTGKKIKKITYDKKIIK